MYYTLEDKGIPIADAYKMLMNKESKLTNLEEDMKYVASLMKYEDYCLLRNMYYADPMTCFEDDAHEINDNIGKRIQITTNIGETQLTYEEFRYEELEPNRVYILILGHTIGRKYPDYKIFKTKDSLLGLEALGILDQFPKGVSLTHWGKGLVSWSDAPELHQTSYTHVEVMETRGSSKYNCDRKALCEICPNYWGGDSTVQFRDDVVLRKHDIGVIHKLS